MTTAVLPVTSGDGSRVIPLVKEKHSRSLLKAISWRITGTVDTMVISYLVTGKVKLAVSIGMVEVFTKIGLFYVHERLWNRIPHGRTVPMEKSSITTDPAERD
jgi:uncharacterized membrane protein